MPTLGDYLALVPSWHSQQPKFMSTIATLVQPLVDAQTMLDKLVRDFDLDTAIGIQLDMLGQWIGRSRYITAEITGVYFSFNLPEQRCGFDQGVWKRPFDADTGCTTLDDDTYRAVLKLQAIANSWHGTVSEIIDAFNLVFPGAAIVDRGDLTDGLMAMDVLIPGPIISTLMIAVLEQDFPIKPSGVWMNFIETTVSTSPLFGFNVDHDAFPHSPIAGFDIGAWGRIIGTSADVT